MPSSDPDYTVRIVDANGDPDWSVITVDGIDNLAPNNGDILQWNGTAWVSVPVGTVAGAYVPKSLYDANTVLAATADDTPAALTVPASTFVGRKAAGNISAMSATEAAALLTDLVPKSLFDAETILTAVSDNTPAALTVPASTMVGRKSTGDIAALTARELWSLLALDAFAPTGVLGETIPRPNVAGGSSAITSGTLYLQAVRLFAGDVVSNLNWKSSATALTRGSNADSHVWFALFTSARVMVACTADDTSAAWGASSVKTLPVATIASGASATYTVPTTGMYYLGLMVAQGTGGSPAVPTLQSANNLDGVYNTKAPILEGSSNTSQTTPQAFPFTANALTATAQSKMGFVS